MSEGRERERVGRWTGVAGAWLGIGASPAALVLGAGLAARHDGPVPLLAFLAGLVFTVALLTAQGRLGLDGGTTAEVAGSLLPRRSRIAFDLMLAVAMVGWFGFNAGLGGAAVAALADLPGFAGPLVFGLPVLALSLGGIRRWNLVAVGTASVALAVAAVVTLRLGAATSPFAVPLPTGQAALADVAALGGYAAVFALRAPDFSAGLASRADLRWCVGLLVGAMAVSAVAGILLYLGTGTADLVGALAGPAGLSAGNLLLALAFVAPAFTAVHSGGPALASATGLRRELAGPLVAGAGLVLAILRFDRLLLPWLALIGAAAPPLIVAMAAEGARRRRGRPPRQVPLWTWCPAAVVGVVLTGLGALWAPLVSFALAGVATMLWVWRVPSRPEPRGHDAAEPWTAGEWDGGDSR